MEGKGLQRQGGDALPGTRRGVGGGGQSGWEPRPGPALCCPLAELTGFLRHGQGLAEPSGAGSAALSGPSPIQRRAFRIIVLS